MANKLIKAIVHSLGLYTQEDMDHLRELSGTDELTGLLNRRGLKEGVEAALYTMERTLSLQKDMCILAIDLDRFKMVNDTYGHATGDNVLRGVADTLRLVFHRHTDLVCRLGGDEFLVVVVGATAMSGATRATLLIKKMIADPGFYFDNAGGRVTASIGVAVIDTSRSDVRQAYEKAVADADRALYEAKEGGRGTICIA